MNGRITRFGVATVLSVVALTWLQVHPAAQGGGGNAGANVPTPRTADGKVDFSGMWGGGGGGGGGDGDAVDQKGNVTVLTRGRPCAPGQTECAPGVNFERDSGIRQRMNANKPWYKPEYWEKVQYLDLHGNTEDPGFGCYPLGVPRMGFPAKIVQTPTELIFLYGARNTFRVIPIDGRPHDPINSVDQTYHGDAVGRWEGDTLVIETVGFTDESWLGWPGYFHTWDMRVEERMTREGNTITYQATVYDPQVLMRPWQMDPLVRRLNPNPKAVLIEDLPCEERDIEHMVTKERG
jgi:hypothetical protein